MLQLPTAGKDSSLMLGAVNHLNLKLEKVKVGAGGGGGEGQKPKVGDTERWCVTHSKMFGVTEERVMNKMLQGIGELAPAAKQLPALPSR